MSQSPTLEAPRVGTPTTGPSAPLVDHKLVFAWFGVSLFWMVLGPVLGLLAAQKLDDPDFLAGIDWLQTTRLRTAHVLGVIFGIFTTSVFGFMCYAVPKLTGRALTNLRAAWAGFWILIAGVTVGEIDILRGRAQGVEAGEYGLVADILITVAFVVLTALFLHTIAHRKEQRLYVSLWYWVAGLLWTCMNYVLGAFILDKTVTGANSAAMNGFYLHNVVGLWITPMGLGIAYYLLPVATKARLFSHRLSLVGFWGLALFYPLNGVHHYIYSPIAEWAQTISIAASMMLIVPVWAFSVNMFGTMLGNWQKYVTDNYVVKFTMLGAVWYLITCFQGPVEALRGMQALTHFGDFNVGHAHSAVYGVFVIWSMAAIYFIFPRLLGRTVWSGRLAAWHYWLQIFGFVLMFGALTIDGLIQGAMLLTAGPEFIDTVVAIKPYWLARTFGGTLMDVGLALFVFNIAMTFVAARRDGPAAPAATAASA
jgi:cytochrome c oxidase cbb3-type subunit 1